MKLLQLTVILLLLCSFSFAQSVAINTDGSTANASSLLDVKSNSKGLLIPRMSSTDRKAIAAPAKGLLVFDNDKAAFMYWDGVWWQMLVPGNSSLGIKREVMAPAAENTRGFGTEVAIKGDYAAIASNKDGDYKGVVYIYEKNANGTWEQKQTLTAPAPKSSDDFGFSLDIDGDYLVVGDPVRQNSSGKEAGIVYVYRRINGTWTHEATIERTTAPAGEKFGWDVAICSTTPQGLVIAVGVPEAKGVLDNRYKAGKVMLYKKSGTSWVLAQNISTLNFQAYDKTGFSVDMDDSVLAFGAPYAGNNRGHYYIYGFDAATNTWKAQYINGANTDGSLAGYAISVSGNRVAVGAPHSISAERGFVNLHIQNPAGWNNTKIYAPIALYETPNAFFGCSVSLDSNNLIVGANARQLLNNDLHSIIWGDGKGSAVLYRLNTILDTRLGYSRQQIMEAPLSYPMDYYGKAVGISEGSFIVSNSLYSSNNTHAVGGVVFGSLD